MIIERSWAMPSANTFSIKPIRELIEDEIIKKKLELPLEGRDMVMVDPFVRNSIFKEECTVTNDLDSDIEADYNMDALEFLKTLPDDYADIVFYDPPFSTRQVSECYKKMGKSVNQETTQATFWTKLKKEIARITKVGGIAISAGYNSGGINKSNGYVIERILLVPHGGIHTDTIITVDRRMK